MTGVLDFIFFEKNRERANHLEQLVNSLRSSLPTGCDTRVRTGDFTDKMSELLNTLEVQRRQGEPMFVMIDPFGVSQTPLKIISKILQNPSHEVYISFMYEPIRRFISTDRISKSLQGLLDTPDWKKARTIADPIEKKNFIYELYKSQLKEAGAKHVHHFDVYRGRDLVYALFFATRNLTGSDKMKQAMWEVAPSGDFAFRSKDLGQVTFGAAILDPDELRRVLVGEFGLNKQLSIEQIEDFMRSDRTTFHSGQLRECLVRMEEQGRIEVVEGTRQRRKKFPHGTRLMFVEPPPPSPPKPSQGEFRF